MKKRNAATMMAAAMTLATVAPAFADTINPTVETGNTVDTQLANGRKAEVKAYDGVYNTQFTTDKKDDTLKNGVVVLQVIEKATTNNDGKYLVSVPFTNEELTNAKKTEIAKAKLALEQIDTEIKHKLSLKFVDDKGVTKDLYTKQADLEKKAGAKDTSNALVVTLLNNKDNTTISYEYQNVTITEKQESPKAVQTTIDLASSTGYKDLSKKTFDLEKTKDITIEKSEKNSTTLEMKVYKTDANKTHIETITVLGYDKFDEAKFTKISGNSDFAGHWAEKEIFNAMYNKAVALSTEFRPNDNITRAEFIKIVNNTFGYETKAQKETFADVNSNDWFYDEVLVAVQEGYIGGYEDGTLRPNQPITREEASVIVAKILNDGKAVETNVADVNGKLVAKDIKTAFKDDKDIAVWADESVKMLSDAKVINGYKDNTFKAKNNISRAEALCIMDRVPVVNPLAK